MRKLEEKLVISYGTTTMALAMEKVCKEKNMPGRIIPLPKEISAGCGLAWASNLLDLDIWKNFMEENNVIYEDMRRIMI